MSASPRTPHFSPPRPVHAASQWLVTAQNKRGYFNVQGFPQVKAPGTYRIFTLGGSTTYGRPYDDKTSFSGWLREFLPMADSQRNWEVINAGGISYASYRVAHLMEELVNYQPDLFIIYTGHNEFLEERTYGQIRDMSPLVTEYCLAAEQNPDLVSDEQRHEVVGASSTRGRAQSGHAWRPG